MVFEDRSSARTFTDSLNTVEAISKSMWWGVPTVLMGYGRETAPIALEPDRMRCAVTPSPDWMSVGEGGGFCDKAARVVLDDAVEDAAGFRSSTVRLVAVGLALPESTKMSAFCASSAL
jgi:hypothetical protein